MCKMEHCWEGAGGGRGKTARESKDQGGKKKNKRKKLNLDGKSRELREMPLKFALQHLWG